MLFRSYNSPKNAIQGAAARTLLNEIRKDMSVTDLLQVDVVGELHVLRVNTEDFGMATEVGDACVNLAVEPTEPTENWVDS